MHRSLLERMSAMTMFNECCNKALGRVDGQWISKPSTRMPPVLRGSLLERRHLTTIMVVIVMDDVKSDVVLSISNRSYRDISWRSKGEEAE